MADVIPNVAFREYATNSAFVLTLSRNQIDALCYVVERGGKGSPLSALLASALMRRGLIEIGKTAEKKFGTQTVVTQFYKPTMAGRLLYRLLYEAGLTQTNEHILDVCPIDISKKDTDHAEEKYAEAMMKS